MRYFVVLCAAFIVGGVITGLALHPVLNAVAATMGATNGWAW